MEKWKKLLKADPTDWLLEKDNPSVRYYTLTEILEKPLKDPDVKEAKEQIMKSELIQKILSKQNPGGYWFEPENFYTKTKYKGTVWNFIILAEVGADKDDKRIKKQPSLFSITPKIQHLVVFLTVVHKKEKVSQGWSYHVSPET